MVAVSTVSLLILAVGLVSAGLLGQLFGYIFANHLGHLTPPLEVFLYCMLLCTGMALSLISGIVNAWMGHTFWGMLLSGLPYMVVIIWRFLKAIEREE